MSEQCENKLTYINEYNLQYHKSWIAKRDRWSLFRDFSEKNSKVEPRKRPMYRAPSAAHISKERKGRPYRQPQYLAQWALFPSSSSEATKLAVALVFIVSMPSPRWQQLVAWLAYRWSLAFSVGDKLLLRQAKMKEKHESSASLKLFIRRAMPCLICLFLN